jgi:hypothetical protein
MHKFELITDRDIKPFFLALFPLPTINDTLGILGFHGIPF